MASEPAKSVPTRPLPRPPLGGATGHGHGAAGRDPDFHGDLSSRSCSRPAARCSGRTISTPTAGPRSIGIFLQVVVHELGTIVVAWRLKLPLRFRFFGFGANATAILETCRATSGPMPWSAFAGPVTGTLVSLALHGIYEITKSQDTSMHRAIRFSSAWPASATSTISSR